MTDLRCPTKKFAELNDGRIEVKCNSDRCGAGPGVVVLHWFDPITGEFLGTQRFKDPMKEGRNYVSDHNPAAVRTP